MGSRQFESECRETKPYTTEYLGLFYFNTTGELYIISKITVKQKSTHVTDPSIIGVSDQCSDVCMSELRLSLLTLGTVLANFCFSHMNVGLSSSQIPEQGPERGMKLETYSFVQTSHLITDIFDKPPTLEIYDINVCENHARSTSQISLRDIRHTNHRSRIGGSNRDEKPTTYLGVGKAGKVGGGDPSTGSSIQGKSKTYRHITSAAKSSSESQMSDFTFYCRTTQS
ncbi:hypothetical protein M426DRAFT_24020 [Hypoxylon sp. CI-4A]|nr:hypothetical protein M426DRAFT_24020 [Hypoxylon sp. CI-4A]